MRNRKGRMPALGMTIVSGETNKKALVFQGLSWRQKFCTLLSIYHTRICVVKRKNTSAYVFINRHCFIFFLTYGSLIGIRRHQDGERLS